MIFLIEIDYYNRVSGTNETLCLTDGPDLSKDGKMFIPALSVGLEYDEALFSRGSSGGDSSSSIGTIVIPNADGKFDYLDRAAFDGREFRSYWTMSKESPDFISYVTGTVSYSEISLKEVVLHISDITQSMDYQMQLGVFAGTNEGMGILGGLEGGEDDIKGQIKPCVYGRCRNIEPYLINAFHLIYACNYDRNGVRKPVSYFWNVYGKGIEYIYEGNVATTELLISASVSAGYYKSCVAEGTFRLGTVPGGTVTCDVSECASSEASASKVIARILEDYPSPPVDSTSLDKLDRDSSCPIGIYITSERTLLEVIREILESLDCWMLPDATGVSSFGRVQLSLDQPKFRLTRDHISDLDRVPTSDNSENIPAYSIRILHTKNWKTIDKGSLALSVTEEMQEFFSTEYRISEGSDLGVLAVNPNSKPIEYETLLQSPMTAKLRNGYFTEAPSGAVPYDWVLHDLGSGGSFSLDTAAGEATVNAGTLATYMKQVVSTPDEIYPGEFTLSLTVTSGSATVIIKDAGITLSTNAAAVGSHSYTFNVTGEVEIWIGCATGTITITGVKLRESSSLGTPQDEVTRRLALRSVPEERYTFKVSHDYAKDIRLGDEITLEYDRFGMEEGRNFIVIGRSLAVPSITVEIDVWRLRNDS